MSDTTQMLATFKHEQQIVFEYPFEVTSPAEVAAAAKKAFEEFARKVPGYSLLDDAVSAVFSTAKRHDG